MPPRASKKSPGGAAGRRVKVEDVQQDDIDINTGGDDGSKLFMNDDAKAKTKGRVEANSKVIYPRRNLPLLLQKQQQQRATTDSSSEGGHDDDDGNNNMNSKLPVVGYVRATPPGHLLDRSPPDHQQKLQPRQQQQQQQRMDNEGWAKIRSDPLKRGTFPKEGFDHILGNHEIRQVDGIPIGGRIVELDGPYPSSSSATVQHDDNDDFGFGDKVSTKSKKQPQQHQNAAVAGEYLEPEEEAALQAELAQRRMALARMENIDYDINNNNDGVSTTPHHHASDGHEYGASRTPLDAPIGSLREKWRVLPHFLKLRGLMKQHIDSFDHFVSVEMKQIVQVRDERQMKISWLR